MNLLPHNHQMWAVIGIYTGREDNMFWRRVRGAAGDKVEAVGARALCLGDAEPLGRDVIPIPRLTGAIHGATSSPLPAVSGTRKPCSSGPPRARWLEEANALFLRS